MKNVNPARDQFCTDLLARMTLDEKVGQMLQANLNWDQDVKQLIREGRIGSMLTMHDVSKFNALQHIAVEESRLGIPLILGNDIIHGYRTIYPIPLALSCSWNPELVEEVARASISEALAHGTSWNFSPMVDISREPRWGRVAEGNGEDPVLGSAISQAWVRGYQSYKDELGRSAAGCVKHFAAYGQPEGGKDYNSVDMSERRLREEYLPPYKAAIDAGVMTVMTSFNDLNGIPATANTFLMKQILRQEWGFEGVLISDFDAIGELIHHRIAADHREAALKAIQAGVDIDMMGNAYHFHLADLVRDGVVAESVIDESVLRILKLKYDLGIFDAPYFEEAKIAQTVYKPEHMALAERAAQESMVLLKNDGALPLQVQGKTIALIGPLADEQQSLLGCWKFSGRAEDVETLHQALQSSLPDGANLIVEKGCDFEGGEIDFDAVIEAANQADVIIMALGESDVMNGEAHNRADIRLPGHQQELADLLMASGKPVSAVLFSGRALVIPELDLNANAILMAWHGGTRTARAVSQILLGEVNPSGRLTASFPLSVGQIPVYYAHKSTGRPVDSVGIVQFNEAHRSNYLDLSNKPLYPFGYGLSYTQFVYSDLSIKNSPISTKGTLEVSVTLHNAGAMAGTETVQLYIQDCFASVTRPVKELKQWRKVNLAAGETREVKFSLPAASLSFLGLDMQPIVEPGKFRLWVGPNAAEGLESSFELV